MEPIRKTLVVNLADDRQAAYDLPADEAVVAAFEQFEKENFDLEDYPRPHEHPNFSEHLKGFACGDWIAYRN